MITWKILIMVWAFATKRPLSEDTDQISFITGPSARNRIAYRTTVPITLNQKWISAARLASFLPERDASSAVVQAPILHPRIM